MSGPVKVVRTKLFIGNLDPGTQPGELSELFGQYGAVLEASVIKDYGFVHYGTTEEAEKAAATLNNKEFHGKRLRVELSTSTVRHRPGQPEPASALRNSRARAAAISSGNGVSRYSPAAPIGGVGPMRHSASAWVRSDARPYDGIPMDPNAMAAAGYGPPSPAAYDRSRPYEVRPDPRQYYPDRRDSDYASGYDVSRDGLYAAPNYSTPGGTGASAQTGTYPMRDYNDLTPHARPNHLGYGGSRIYDRNSGTSRVDPYYTGGLPQGQPPPPPVDPYHGYDHYQKYYTNRPRDSEYSLPPGQNPLPRDYDAYPNYRADPYGSAANQPTRIRHDLAVAFQQPQTGYPPTNPQRAQHTYGNPTNTQPASYASTLTQYYSS